MSPSGGALRVMCFEMPVCYWKTCPSWCMSLLWMGLKPLTVRAVIICGIFLLSAFLIEHNLDTPTTLTSLHPTFVTLQLTTEEQQCLIYKAHSQGQTLAAHPECHCNFASMIPPNIHTMYVNMLSVLYQTVLA